MSVHNGGVLLDEAVQSIRNQTLRDFEFIIVDDASTDGTADYLAREAAADTRIRLLTNDTNMGLTRSLNRAFAAATGGLIARQDADDVSKPERFEQQVRFLDRHPDIGLLGTWYEVIDATGTLLAVNGPPVDDLAIRWTMLFNNPFCHSSMMFRRDVLRDDPWVYDPALRYSQDFSAWSRLLQRTKGANIPNPLVQYRSHAANLSALHTGDQQGIADSIALANMKAAQAHAPSDAGQMGRLRAMNRIGAAVLGHESGSDVAVYFAVLSGFVGATKMSWASRWTLVWSEFKKFLHPARIASVPWRLRLTIVLGLLRAASAAPRRAA